MFFLQPKLLKAYCPLSPVSRFLACEEFWGMSQKKCILTEKEERASKP